MLLLEKLEIALLLLLNSVPSQHLEEPGLFDFSLTLYRDFEFPFTQSIGYS